VAAPKLGSRIAVRFREAGRRSDLPELRGAAAIAAEFVLDMNVLPA
jgi:hypothetical protein